MSELDVLPIIECKFYSYVRKFGINPSIIVISEHHEGAMAYWLKKNEGFKYDKHYNGVPILTTKKRGVVNVY